MLLIDVRLNKCVINLFLPWLTWHTSNVPFRHLAFVRQGVSSEEGAFNRSFFILREKTNTFLCFNIIFFSLSVNCSSFCFLKLIRHEVISSFCFWASIVLISCSRSYKSPVSSDFCLSRTSFASWICKFKFIFICSCQNLNDFSLFCLCLLDFSFFFFFFSDIVMSFYFLYIFQ